ncbi:hypothetical protein I79_007091 [Cricetulus griseus]|uniref:Uncharacterized protein n=1 Tax=Cricetulus griseus TaxID=10029 RepID=G3H9L5_CRIGR|nr:hypothetical protein I79_007091 [Cricetulus griseus]
MVFQTGSDIARRLIFKKRKKEVSLSFPSAPAPAAPCDPPARRDANKASDKISLIKYIDV